MGLDRVGGCAVNMRQLLRVERRNLNARDERAARRLDVFVAADRALVAGPTPRARKSDVVARWIILRCRDLWRRGLVFPHTCSRDDRGGGVVPLQYLVVLLLSAGLARLTELGIILAAEPRLRLRIVSAAGAASLVVAFRGWLFQSQYRRSIRLATGQGGAEVVHVIFLLLIAVGLAEFLRRGGNRKLGIGLMPGAMIRTLAPRSRGALLALGTFVVLLALGWVLNGTRSIWKLWPLALALIFGSRAGAVGARFRPNLQPLRHQAVRQPEGCARAVE